MFSIKTKKYNLEEYSFFMLKDYLDRKLKITTFLVDIGLGPGVQYVQHIHFLIQ